MNKLILLLLVCMPPTLAAQVTHILTATDFEFTPAEIFAEQGDSLRIIFTNPEHTFTQVDESTWNENGNTPAGFINLGPGLTESTIPLDASGTIHYVSIPFAAVGMKGIVDVALVSGMQDRMKVVDNALYPNPAKEQLWLREPPNGMLDMFFIDASGREVKRKQTYGTPIYVGDLASGAYVVRVVDSAGREEFRQRVHIE